MEVSSTPSVQLFGNSVRPILFVFEGSTDHHASLNAGWFIQGRQTQERKRHRNRLGRCREYSPEPVWRFCSWFDAVQGASGGHHGGLG